MKFTMNMQTIFKIHLKNVGEENGNGGGSLASWDFLLKLKFSFYVKHLFIH